MIVMTLLVWVVLSTEVVLAVLPVSRGRDETQASDWPFGLGACYWPREELVNSLRLFRGMTPPLRACWPSFELRAYSIDPSKLTTGTRHYSSYQQCVQRWDLVEVDETKGGDGGGFSQVKEKRSRTLFHRVNCNSSVSWQALFHL